MRVVSLCSLEFDAHRNELQRINTAAQTSGANNGIPSIVGWDEDIFRLSMLDYRTKVREHPVMNMIAGRLSDEEIAALSSFFTKLEISDEK